ncbi:Ulp1 family isopeptidase [Bradyrhizobium sp. WSM2793]|uniref:Ulp1 family isopeptidase n=1 Tax=Bradyrhizobium sp. WSM2793 TaxID=1038866 RepID=UPI00352902FA
MPVNDGGVSGGGAHWSLLLVDRRVPTAPVAYHYDSARSRNSTVAEQLAARLGYRLQPARMARQQNGHDCGVYVVDATRALIGRLAQGERPAPRAPHRRSAGTAPVLWLYSCGRVIRFAFRRSNPQLPLTFR